MAADAATRYQLLSWLLSYPSDEIVTARDELAMAASSLGPGRAREAIRRFLDYFGREPAMSLQQHYVETFDLQKRSSLYLTFFTHGDTRKRGQELLRLKRLYRSVGFVAEGPELPDYLPLVLEFASLDPEHGEWILREHQTALELLRLHLAERRSPYASLIEALRAGLPALAVSQLSEVRRMLAAGPPREEVGLEPFAPPEVMPEARR